MLPMPAHCLAALALPTPSPPPPPSLLHAPPHSPSVLFTYPDHPLKSPPRGRALALSSALCPLTSNSRPSKQLYGLHKYLLKGQKYAQKYNSTVWEGNFSRAAFMSRAFQQIVFSHNTTSTPIIISVFLVLHVILIISARSECFAPMYKNEHS